MNIPLEDAIQYRTIIRISSNGRQTVQDCLLREENWALLLNGRQEAELACLPFHLEELALGHLFCEGLLASMADIRSLSINRDKHQIEVHSDISTLPCPLPVTSPPPDMNSIRLDSRVVLYLQRLFNECCVLFHKTGAAHSCALADEHKLLLFMEDVARHNALDKVIGAMLRRRIDPAGKVLLFSGRLALDMLNKAVRSGVCMLVAPGAPSLAAVDMAEAAGIALLGFVQPGNINIYTHPECITGDLLE